MLEWITSKVVVSIAALLILVSVGGFFVTEREGWKDAQATNISKEIAKLVNQVSTLNSNLTTVIHFGDGDSGINLPSNVDGASYVIKFDRTTVRCELNGRSSRSDFYTGVHLYSPSDIDLKNLTQKREHDLDHQTMITHSAGKIVLMRAKAATSGAAEFETFVFIGD
jgi:hypothetical protein